MWHVHPLYFVTSHRIFLSFFLLADIMEKAMFSVNIKYCTCEHIKFIILYCNKVTHEWIYQPLSPSLREGKCISKTIKHVSLKTWNNLAITVIEIIEHTFYCVGRINDVIVIYQVLFDYIQSDHAKGLFSEHFMHIWPRMMCRRVLQSKMLSDVLLISFKKF